MTAAHPVAPLNEETVHRLRQHLDGRWGHVRESARKLSERELFRPVPGLSIAEHRARTLAQLLSLCDEGMTGYGFPEAYGGGGDIGASITAFDMLGMGDLSLLVKTGVQFGLFGGAVLHLGTEIHHQRYLADIAAGRLLGCFAMTEHGHGSDVACLGTTATYDPVTEEFVVLTPDDEARKEYIGNAAQDGRIAAVFAQLVSAGQSHGVHCFLVPIRDEGGQPLPGIRIADCGPKAGLNGVDNGQLWFDAVRIPRQNLLNRYAQVDADGTYRTEIENSTKRFFTMLGTLIQGRISVAGAAISATKSALTIATRYADTRTQFSAPGRDGEVVLLDYLVHQRKLLPTIAKSYALHFAQSALVETLHEVFTAGDPDDPRRRELEARAAGVKASATWHATAAIQICREACGGAGYLSENRLPDLKADTDVFTTFEGDNTVLLQLVAKELLTSYRDHFGELDVLGTVKFVANQAVGNVLERTAARSVIQRLLDAAGRDDDAEWTDRGWHISLFDFREKHLLDGLARRLRKAAGAPDPFAVFNQCQDHLLATARAHVDRILLEAFVAGIDSCPDPAAKEQLERLCDLFVLSTVEAERAWFIEHGRLPAARTKMLPGVVNDLCGQLRPNAVGLVNAFGVPDIAVDVPLLR
ncbi:acyl-CoA dehydrogenase family protein [Jatrophihabitans telluris]|uniref:Acyl-CoA dehydrogenase family protein n=1 Tax=Jatrophihabitans telluris TaxID=2038343 RepID=A0ABY4QYI6_9ACTN|nr:acyl-CoA dehydrogenase [Jatrophihabitans telluris]UQX88352.1 acyl-CoA dehydrogenase family protein [Jatrophihabitans telluris]